MGEYPIRGQEIPPGKSGESIRRGEYREIPR